MNIDDDNNDDNNNHLIWQYHQWQAPLLLSWNQNVLDDIHWIFMMMIHDNFNNDNDNDDNDNHLIWQLSPVASPSTPQPAPFPLMSIHSKGGDDDCDDEYEDDDDEICSISLKVTWKPIMQCINKGQYFLL